MELGIVISFIVALPLLVGAIIGSVCYLFIPHEVKTQNRVTIILMGFTWIMIFKIFYKIYTWI